MERKPMHYGLPVVDGYAWAFNEEMIYDAWAQYVETNPARFDMASLMRCASLPPQVEEAIATVRGHEGKMGADVVRLVQKHSERLEFRHRAKTCPGDCVCPGNFQPVELKELPDAVREEVWRAGIQMGVTPAQTVYRARVK